MDATDLSDSSDDENFDPETIIERELWSFILKNYQKNGNQALVGVTGRN